MVRTPAIVAFCLISGATIFNRSQKLLALPAYPVMLSDMRSARITAALLAIGLAACGSSLPETDPSTLTLEEFEENSEAVQKPPEDPAANPDAGAVDECSVECRSKADCCEGYYCGKDPERSRRKEYCLPAG